MRSTRKITNIFIAMVLGLVAITAGNRAYAQLGDWDTKTSMPTDRWGAVAGVIDGKLYVAGGWNGTISLAALEVYDPATDSWETKAPMPTARNDAGGGVIDGKLYVVGGLSNNQKQVTLQVYDPVTNVWSTKAPMYTPRSSLMAAAIDGKLYAAGGCSGWCAPVTNVLEVYDPASDTWTYKASMPTGRGYADVTLFNGLLYVMGGCCGWDSAQSNLMARTIEVYDPTANTWAAKAQHVVGSSDTAGVINGKIYVAKDTATEVYEPSADTWGSLSAMPTARQNTVGGVINGKLYVAGGYIAGQAAAALEVYTPDRDADGIIDSLDTFPNDPAASKDTDGDGCPDEWNANATAEMIEASALVLDAFPNDPAASKDTDGDGCPDEWNANATAEMIAASPLVLDVFLNDPAASKDTDGDGYPDEWNANATAEMIEASALVLDAFPNDSNKWLPKMNLPAQPVLVSPPSPSILDTLTPVLRVGAFSDPNGDTHLMTHWQVSISGTELDFENYMVLDLESETSLTSLQLPDFILQENLDYYWRVKFIDQNQYESAWSNLFSFRTPEDSQDPDGDGIEDEFKIPTPVDLDGNGENDNLQADIKSIATIVGDAQAGVKASTGVISVEQVKSINPKELPRAGKPENLPYGLVSFRLQVTLGADAEVVVYFSEALSPEMKWYKYDPASGWYDFSANAVFNSTRTAVTLRLTDGGAGDADGVANGVIVDPSGPGTATVSADSNSGEGSSGGGGGGGCFISVATDNPIKDKSFIIGLFAISLLLIFLGSVSRRKENQ